jgi:hypothetical protein
MQPAEPTATPAAAPAPQVNLEMPKLMIVKQQTTLQKVGITLLWVVASSVLSFVLSTVTNHPELFGIYAPIINIVLVTIKSLIDPNVPNA